jgi:hypothetical protein
MYSFDVKVEDKNVPRQMDIMMHNKSSISGTPPYPCVQPGGDGPLMLDEDDEKGELIEVKWDSA